jgi:hypothetical protein
MVLAMQEVISDLLLRHHGKPVSLDDLADILGMHREAARDWLYVHALTNPWMSMDRGESWKRRPAAWQYCRT